MSFATRIAAASASPVYVLEFEGDEINASDFDAVTNWTLAADGANKAADATDAKAGTASVGWDKSGTASNGCNMDLTTTAFNFSDHGYLTIMVKAPTVTAGTMLQLNFIIGQDATTNRYKWVIPWAFFTEGAWHRLYLSTSEVDSGYTSFAAEGSVSPLALDTVRLNWQGTSAAITYTGCRVDALRGHPYRMSTSRVLTPVADTKTWLQVPSITPSAYRVVDGSLTGSTASCPVVDGDAATVVQAVANYAMPGRVAWIKMGFRGDAETDANYTKVFTGVADDLDHLGRGWGFQLGDVLRLLDRPFVQTATEDAPVTLTGNPLTVLLQVLLSTGNGTNNSTYDTLASGLGAGIPADLVDVAGIEDQRTNWFPLDVFEQTFTEPEPSVLTWAYDQIFKAYAVAPRLLIDGSLSCRAVRPPFGNEDAQALGTSNVASALVPPFRTSLDLVYNQVRVKYDYDPVTDTYGEDTADTYQNATSVARYGVREFLIEAKSIPVTSAATVARVAARYLSRLSNGSPPIQLIAARTTQPIGLGDTVSVTLPRVVPDITSGAYGVTSLLCEVTSRGWDPESAACHFIVQASSYLAGNFRLIGPTSLTTDYDASSADEVANYLFISDASDQLGTANDDTHSIGPG